MPSLCFEAAALGILAACEMIARSIWPELFEDRAIPPSDETEGDGWDGDPRDEMAVW